jgi:branched-chain amino acid transport system permease protein
MVSAEVSPLLEARELTKSFGGLIAVDQVSLAIEPGTVTALIGPNGAGKSTFFKMLAGEIAPTSGDIMLRGQRITGSGAASICQLGIAKSYQVTQIFPKLTVVENLMIPALASIRGRFRADVFRSVRRVGRLAELVESVLSKIRLTERAEMRAGDLSYGEKRRLEVGLALATEPELLLLDEPAAGMSARETHDTIELIKTLRKTLTIVIVEHDMDVVFGLADKIMVLQDGKTIAYDVPEAIRRDPRVQEAYLGGIEDVS